MKMTTDMDEFQIGVLLVCLFNPGWGILTITSTPFECGRSASIVCSRLDETVGLISWYMNGIAIRKCKIDRCRNPTFGNYNFAAGGGVWTIVIDPVELKDNNITFTCEPYSSESDAPFRVLLTTDVSVPMDISSTLTKIENTTDVILKAQTNCVKPVESVDITWQCVKADQVNVIDSDCRLTTLPTYTSECRDLNQTCAGPGTHRMGSDVKLPAYRGNYFKLVKLKAVFTDGTTVIEKISGEVKQGVPPQITTLRDCSAIENTDFTMNCILSSGDPSTVKCTWTAPSKAISNDCYLRIPSVQRTGSGIYTCRVENSVGTDTKSFYLDILYPPEKPVLKIVDTDVTNLTANVLKDTVVTIRCSSSAKPNILSYTWESAEGSVDSQLRITDTSSPFTRTYTCTATNYTNQLCGGNGAQGSISSSVNVHIVYPPEGQTIRFNGSHVIDTSGSISVIRGQSFTLTCSAKSDPESTYRWDKTTQDGSLLSINNIGLDQSHTCTASNEMRLYNGSTFGGESKLTVDIEVLYKTVISALTIDDREDSLVVNQNKTDVQFKCNVSSNPLSQISLHSTTISGSRILKEELSSDYLLYSLPIATCWDSGIYTCSGRNNVTENKVSKAVILLVECTARPLHETEPIITIYRGVGEDVTLNLTMVAYPLPGSELFQWYKLEQEHSITPLNGSIVNLSDTSLESKLRLTNIQGADFGLYKLTIKYNDILTAYVQYYSIQPKVESDTRSPNNGAIIRGAVGGGAAVIGVIIVVVVFLRRKAAAKPRRSTDSQRRKANERDIDDLTTGTQEHNGPNEYYNISSILPSSSSGPYEDLNQWPSTNHEYSTMDRIDDDKTTTSLPTPKTYENLQLTPRR